MALEDYRADVLRCSRCSYCKWIPFDHVKSWRFAKGCPSIDYNKFQPYSAAGRLVTGLSLMDGRCDVTDRVIDVAFKCQLCGSCDVACKVCRYDMEPLLALHELRFKLVEEGHTLPQNTPVMEGFRKEHNMLMKPKGQRGKWADGLKGKDLSKEKAEVVFHAGCRSSYDRDLAQVPSVSASILQKAGVDFGILGKAETCCGGRAFHMGYRADFTSAAKHMVKTWTNAGVKTVVTPCADCFHTFRRLYPEVGSQVEVLHMVEFVDRLVKQGKIKLSRPVTMKITYHDPCHLGRQGEPYVPWKGKERKIFGQAVVYDPPRPRYNGAKGVYEPPRNVLKAIPGLELVEMERIKEASWCCGAGGGVRDAYPEFSSWTAGERIEEAMSTGAEAIVSACPWCERNFMDAVNATGGTMKVFDVMDLVQQAI